ncbi:MAG TPA: FAD-binding oxidoreductase [Gaiellaceae bacterium]|nr:FAD-binding oxidoreductase [Gaiellaceae bacterium]
MDNVMQLAEVRAPHVRDVRANLAGELVLPGDTNWDEARLAWHLAVDQRPAAVAIPENVNDVIEIVVWARENDLRVAPQGTGHNAPALGDLAGTVLMKMHELKGVTIDSEARIARANAGAIWIEVVEAAAEHGLAALAGSSPDVGVVGYTLGGGLSWLARKHGIGANLVVAVELVTADGDLLRVDRDNDPDLFWAVRGGGGAFGVVTAIEFELIELTEVYAGHLFFPIERAAEVLRAWRDWTGTVPDEITSVGRLLQLPPIPEIPEPFRGNSYVVVQAIYCGDDVDEAQRLLEPVRALGAAVDTFGVMPVPALSRLHMDPEEPTAGMGDGGTLRALDDEAVDAFVAAVVGTPIVAAEVRHLGGAVARAKAEHGALASFDAPYLTFGVGMIPVPELREPLAAAVRGFVEALEPWAAEHTYLNFAEGPRAAMTLWTESALHRLRRIKAQVDPANVIRSNHELG